MKIVSLFVFAMMLMSCKNEKKRTFPASVDKVAADNSLIYPEEGHFKSLRQVTFGGDNAEGLLEF